MWSNKRQRIQNWHQYTDKAAGTWPPAVVEGLGVVVQRCICMHARVRAAVCDVIPMLDVLLLAPALATTTAASQLPATTAGIATSASRTSTSSDID